MFVMEHYYDRVPLFLFPEFFPKIWIFLPEKYFTHTTSIRVFGKIVKKISFKVKILQSPISQFI